MYCNPAEIEKKRQEALQKLAQKRNSPLQSAANPPRHSGSSTSNQPQTGFKFTRSPSWKTKPYDAPKVPAAKTCLEFYGKRTINVSLSLITEERFCAKLSIYVAEIVERFREVPSRNYDPQTHMWNFHINDHTLVIEKLKACTNKDNIIIQPLPKFVLNCVRSPQLEYNPDLTSIDPVLLQTLLPYQLEGLQFGIEKKGRCLIADDMGLGKTFQALAIANYYKSDWPLLIVTTSSMKTTWEETIMKYMPSVPMLKIQYMSSGKDYIGEAQILIVSYELMMRHCQVLLDRHFGCVIVDESHNLKNYKAKVTQAASRLCKEARRVVLLSGTPALSKPSELYPQLAIVDPQFFGSFIEYASRYCDLRRTHFGIDVSGSSHLQELEIVLKRRFMIRRKKEDVLGALPDKRQEAVKLDVDLRNLSEEDRKLLLELSMQFDNARKSTDKHSILLNWFNETATVKIPAVCSHIQGVAKSGEKFLVFGHHRVMLDAIETTLQHLNVGYVRIDGNTVAEQRKSLIDRFQLEDDCVCAVLSITATNAGITLTAARSVIFAELHWNPSILSQAEGRAHRIGQKNSVLVQYLLASGTSDDHMWKRLRDKENVLKEMGLTKETFTHIPEKEQSFCESAIDQSEEAIEDDVFDDGLDSMLCNIDMQ